MFASKLLQRQLSKTDALFAFEIIFSDQFRVSNFNRFSVFLTSEPLSDYDIEIFTTTFQKKWW